MIHPRAIHFPDGWWQHSSDPWGRCSGTRGLLVVSSAGNEGFSSWQHHRALRRRYVFCIGGVTLTGAFALFSSRGPSGYRVNKCLSCCRFGTSGHGSTFLACERNEFLIAYHRMTHSHLANPHQNQLGVDEAKSSQQPLLGA